MRIRNHSNQNVWVAVVIGLFFMIFPIFLFVNNDSIKKSMDSQVMSSSVYHLKEKSRSRKGHTTTVYRPIYKYQVSNKVYTCSSKTASTFKSYDNQMIYYKSYKPQDCIVETTKQEIGIYILVSLMGLFAVVFSFFKPNE